MSTNYTRILEKICFIAPTTGEVVKELCRADGTMVTTHRGTYCNPKYKKTVDNAKAYYEKREIIPSVTVRKNDEFSLFLFGAPDDNDESSTMLVLTTDLVIAHVDSREIAQCIINHGAMVGGYLMGKFVWASATGGGVMPILVGGTSFNELVKLRDAERAQARDKAFGMGITDTTIARGHVYVDKYGQELLFVGRVKQPGKKTASYAFFPVPTYDKNNNLYDYSKPAWSSLRPLFNEKTHELRTLEETEVLCKNLYKGENPVYSEKITEYTMTLQKAYLTHSNMSCEERIEMRDYTLPSLKYEADMCNDMRCRISEPTHDWHMLVLSSTDRLVSDTGMYGRLRSHVATHSHEPRRERALPRR